MKWFRLPVRSPRRRRVSLVLEQLEKRECPAISVYVVDTNAGLVLPANSTPINSFSDWTMNLQAQVSGGSVSSYSWSFTGASDATSISGSSTYAVQWTWSSFTGAPKSDTVSLTVTPTSGSPVTESFVFKLTATNSPAWSSAPTSASTWPSVIAPDQLLSNQATEPAGPCASMGLADGSLQISHSMPSYNPNVAPMRLQYSLAVANPRPIFLVGYPLGSSLPSSVTAQLREKQRGQVRFMAYRKSSATQHRKYKPWSRSRSSLMFSSFSSVKS